MYAVIFDNSHRIIFSPEPVSDDVRGKLLGEMGGRVLEDVDVEIPDSIYEWPRGQDRPENVLAVARDNPRRFQAFKYGRDIPASYEPSGMNYFEVPSWEQFLEALKPLEGIAKIPDETDPPGWEEDFMRGIDANRGPDSKLFEGMY